MSTQQVPFIAFTSPDRKNNTVDIKSIIQKYSYHWPLFVIGLSLSMAAFFVYIKVTKPTYEVRATILIQNETKSPGQQSPLHEIDLLSSSRIIENEFEIFKSKQLISQVIDDLKLAIGYYQKDGLSGRDLYKNTPVKLTLLKATGNYEGAKLQIKIKDKTSFFITMPDGNLKEFSFKDSFNNNFGVWKLEPTKNLDQYQGQTIQIVVSDPDKLALDYQKLISISLTNKLSTAAVLILNDNVPQRGKDILNQLIYNYKLAGTIIKERETKSTLDFLDQRLASLTGELDQAEKGIETFKSSRGLTDISSDAKISLENMQSNDARLNEVNVQLSVIEGIERYINSSQNLGKAPATLGIEDPALSSLIEKLAQLQLQRERLLATTPETNPDFEPINRQIVTTKAAIKENVGNIRSSLQNTREKLQSFNNRFASSIKNIPVQERQYVSIKRQQAIKESLYTYLLQKREEISVSYASTLADDRIVDQAYAGPPKNSLKAMVFAALIFLGLGFPAGLIYARGIVNPKVTDIQDIKESLGIPLIGELPYEAAKNFIIISKNNASAISEQFRALRIKMFYLYGQKENGRVTLITSSVSGEGKTFVSSNLGVTLAYSGRKTIILELDMRKPKMAEAFKLENAHPGMSDFLNGNATEEQIIQGLKSEPALDLITCGTPVQNPSELLETKRLKYLIDSLRDQYDDIIIDSPPVHLVPDAMILTNLSDITLYVIRQGYTEKNELIFLKELDNQKQLTNVNIVFNGIQKARYGYGYDYNKYYYSAKRQNRISLIFSDIKSRF